MEQINKIFVNPKNAQYTQWLPPHRLIFFTGQPHQNWEGKLTEIIKISCLELTGNYWSTGCIPEQVLQRWTLLVRQWVVKFSWDFPCIFFFFSHHQLYSQLFSCPAFGLFVVFLFSWLVPTTLPSYSFLQAYSMDNTFKSDFFVGSNIQKDIFLPIVSKILGLFVSLSILKLLSHSWNICFPSILLCPCLFKMMPETSVSCSYRPWNWPSAILVEYSEHRTYCELEESQ